MKAIRCAIYTRKSSEEGLEQDFNSLHAQREACAAYILSQASGGWTALPDIYDDGGISGGTLERPGLQRLLADVQAGRIDIIVVYKVDRLTRSLLDFSKLVEAFDAASVSFVSVTQSFNTTTSMGRLTLNMLLSFAQFEREVTAERIRDKIAASKAKGMWMGGTPPLGYEPDGRSLKISEHASLIRDIFARYLDLGTVRQLQEALTREGVRLPVRYRIRNGEPYGGGFFSRGQLYAILSNPVYTGRVAHKGQLYWGQHPAIIDTAMWDAVQASLAANIQGSRSRARAAQPSLLAGKVVDCDGQPLIAAHATKGKVRYRYYVSKALHDATGAAGMRVPARGLENIVVERLAQFFDDPVELIASAWLDVPPPDYAGVTHRAAETGERVRLRDRTAIDALIHEVRIGRDGIRISCNASAVAMALEATPVADAPPLLTIVARDVMTRTGKRLRLIEGGTAGGQPNVPLVRLVAQAHRLWGVLRSERIDITRLAERENMSAPYLTRVLRLAFLSPKIIEMILAGKQPNSLTVHRLTLAEPVDSDWQKQVAALL